MLVLAVAVVEYRSRPTRTTRVLMQRTRGPRGADVVVLVVVRQPLRTWRPQRQPDEGQTQRCCRVRAHQQVCPHNDPLARVSPKAAVWALRPHLRVR